MHLSLISHRYSKLSIPWKRSRTKTWRRRRNRTYYFFQERQFFFRWISCIDCHVFRTKNLLFVLLNLNLLRIPVASPHRCHYSLKVLQMLFWYLFSESSSRSYIRGHCSLYQSTEHGRDRTWNCPKRRLESNDDSCMFLCSCFPSLSQHP